MKRLSFIFALTLLFFLAACSDEESSWSAADTCPADGYNVYGMPNRGTFVDERDGQVYKYTTIGDQVWMAQNLNYASEYSTTNDSLKDCAECGLWYGLAKSSLNGRDFIDTICPAGWKVPTEEEWEKLFSSVGGRSKAMKILATENWSTSFQGTNECGFSAIESSEVIIGTEVIYPRCYAIFWTQWVTRPEFMKVVHFSEWGGARFIEGMTSNYFSIRCIKD